MSEERSRLESIPIENLASVSQEALDALRQLTAELTAVVGDVCDAHLDRLVVVPPGEVGTIAFSSEGHVMRKPAGRAFRPEASTAFAASVINETGLHTYIVIDAAYVRPLSGMRYHRHDTISLVLEELLHAELYTIRWRRGPHLECLKPGIGERLIACAATIHDEYIVAQRKAEILASVPLVDDESGGLNTEHVQYGIYLDSVLDRAPPRIEAIKFEGRVGRLPYATAWEDLVSTLLEFIFGPLARDAGYRAGSPPGTKLEDSHVLQSEFFVKTIGPYWWPPVLVELERSSASELGDMDRTLTAIATVLSALLNAMGVIWQPLGSGGWWVQFLPFANCRQL